MVSQKLASHTQSGLTDTGWPDTGWPPGHTNWLLQCSSCFIRLDSKILLQYKRIARYYKFKDLTNQFFHGPVLIHFNNKHEAGILKLLQYRNGRLLKVPFLCMKVPLSFGCQNTHTYLVSRYQCFCLYTCIETHQYCDGLERTIKEFVRVLKPDIHVYVTAVRLPLVES